MIVDKFEQTWNAPDWICVTLLGIVTLCRLVQPAKAEASMEVTRSGMITEVREVSPAKVPYCIFVTLLSLGITRSLISCPFR